MSPMASSPKRSRRSAVVMVSLRCRHPQMGLRRINFDNALFVMDSGSRYNKFVFDLLTFQLLLSYSSIIYDYLNSLKRSLSRFDITGWYSINGGDYEFIYRRISITSYSHGLNTPTIIIVNIILVNQFCIYIHA